MKTSLAVLALVSFMFAACATAPNATTAQGDAQEITGTNGQTGPGAETAIATKPSVASGDLAAQAQAIQQNSVYFDFDEFTIKPEYHGIIEQLAAFMKAHENTAVTLEGNADERGSGEYNLSLGSKRAFAVRKSLEVMGIPGRRIETVSLGEEKPRLACHEEICWKENRRTDLIIKQVP